MILKTKRLNNELWAAVYRRMRPEDPCWLLVAVFTLDENVFPSMDVAGKLPIDMAGLFAWQINRTECEHVSPELPVALIHFYDTPGAPAILTVVPEGAEPYIPNVD